MTVEQFLALFTSSSFVPLLVKFFLLFLIFLYAIFAGVVVRQVQLMNKIVTQYNFAPILFAIALIHFILVVALFFLGVLLL